MNGNKKKGGMQTFTTGCSATLQTMVINFVFGQAVLIYVIIKVHGFGD